MIGETVAERVERRLKAVGLSPRAASLKAGLSADAIRSLRRLSEDDPAATPRGRTLQKLAPVLQTSVEWLLTGDGQEDLSVREGGRRRSGRGEVLAAPGIAVPDPATLPRDLPVVGTAYGSIVAGKSGVFEGFEIDPERIVDRVGRPPVLAGTPDAYAVYIAGDSMAPLHPAGELRVVHPHRPVRPGDLALIQVRIGPGLPLAAFLKYFVTRTDNFVVARQINPEATHRFAANTVVAVHRVLSYGELIGV